MSEAKIFGLGPAAPTVFDCSEDYEPQTPREEADEVHTPARKVGKESFELAGIVKQIVEEFNQKIADLTLLAEGLPGRLHIDISGNDTPVPSQSEAAFPDKVELSAARDSMDSNAQLQFQRQRSNPAEYAQTKFHTGSQMSLAYGTETSLALDMPEDLLQPDPTNYGRSKAGSCMSLDSIESMRSLRSDSTTCTTASKASQAHALSGCSWNMKDTWVAQGGGPNDDGTLGATLSMGGKSAQLKTSLRQRQAHPNAPGADSSHGQADRGDFSHIEQLGGCMRHVVGSPGSTFRISWELAGIMFVMYDVIAIPLTEAFQLPATLFTDCMGWLVLAFWTCNVPMTLTTGYISNGILICNPALIFRQYCRSWLLVDALTVLPEWVLTISSLVGVGQVDAGSYVKLLRALRFVRMARLLRLAKLKDAWEKFYDMLDSEKVGIWLDISKMMMVLFVVSHYVACAWFAIGNYQSSDSWTKAYGLTGENVHWTRQYVSAYHWSISQFTPASMEVGPQCLAEQVYAVFIVIFALVGFSYLIGSITGAMARLRQMGETKTQLFWLLRRFMRKNKVPIELSTRIKSYVHSVWDHKQAHLKLEHLEILNLLSENLKSELALSIHTTALNVHPLFLTMHRESAISMQRLALSGLSQVSLAPDDMMFVAGELATSMAMVIGGLLEYWRMKDSEPEGSESHAPGTQVEIVEAAEDWIAEPALWVTEWHYLGHLRSVSSTALLIIDPGTFASVMELNPVAYTIACNYAIAYGQRLNASGKESLSDIAQHADIMSLLSSISVNPVYKQLRKQGARHTKRGRFSKVVRASVELDRSPADHSNSSGQAQPRRFPSQASNMSGRSLHGGSGSTLFAVDESRPHLSSQSSNVSESRFGARGSSASSTFVDVRRKWSSLFSA